MARDPFAPVTQSSVPPWIWLVAGTFMVLLIGMGATVFLVISRRPPPEATATPSKVTPTAPSAPTASVASAAPDREGSKAPEAGKIADKDSSKEDPDAADGRHHRGGHPRHGGKGQASAHETSPSPSPAGGPGAPKPPKKKVDMSQKEIDNLLGL